MKHMIYNITHGSDIDGMTCAALLVRFHEMPIENIVFSQPYGKEFDDSVEYIKRIRVGGSLLVISDIAMSAVNNAKMAGALSIFKKRGNRVVWFDHHGWDLSSVKALSKYCDLIVMGELDVCGAELVYRYLIGKNKFGEKLARIAHFADFAIYPKKYEKLIWNVNYAMKILGRGDNIANPKLRRLVALIANGRYGDRFITKTADSYLKRSRPYLESLMKNAKAIDIGGIRIVVGFSEKLANQVACMDLLKKFRADIAVYVPIDTGHCSIRCIGRIDRKRMVRIGDIDGAKLARTLGGNGHPLASGFGVEVEGGRLSGREIKELEDRIIEKAKNIYGR